MWTKKLLRDHVEIQAWRNVVGRPHVRIELTLPLALTRDGRAALARARATRRQQAA